MSRRLWTPLERELVRELYPFASAIELAEWLGRGVSSIYQCADQLGVKKSREIIAQLAFEQSSRPEHRGKLTRFKPGQVAWNKGKHYIPSGRAAETQFKKGGLPPTTLPVGSTRLTKDGYLERKYQEAKGPPGMRWRSEHRLIWEAANGPMPKGHLIVFKPGTFSNVEGEIKLENLECLSRQENGSRNTPWNRTPELGHLVQLKGAITRQVNRIARESAK